MRNRALIIAIACGIAGTFATLAFAQPPALSAPALEVSVAMDADLSSFMRFGGFQTELESWEPKQSLADRVAALEGKSGDCTCVDCKCSETALAAQPMVEAAPAMTSVTRYRTETRQTGRMIPDCQGGVCVMVPETVSVSVPYEVQVPVGTEYAMADSVMSDVCPDCGQVHMSVAGPMINRSGLLMTQSRPRLFQPLRRWRQRLSSGKLFPNAWWNR